MGIKGLSKFLKENVQSLRREFPLSAFEDEIIGVDIYLWLHANKAVATKEITNQTNVMIEEANEFDIFKTLIRNFIAFLKKLLMKRITPLIVFDGEPLLEKESTREERRAERAKAKERIDKIKEKIAEDILSVPAELIIELRKLLNNYVFLKDNEVKQIKELLATIGIPFLQAKHDAEFLCSMLCREGIIKGVYSKDTDNIALGCPVTITDISNHSGELTVTVYEYHKIMFDLRAKYGEIITDSFFLEFCIMCGCDFNRNIYKVGPGTAMKLLLKHKTIDEIKRNTSHDISCLKHVRCKEIFSPVSSKSLIVGEERYQVKKPNFKNFDESFRFRDLLEKYDVSDTNIERLVEFYDIIEKKRKEINEKREINNKMADCNTDGKKEDTGGKKKITIIIKKQ